MLQQVSINLSRRFTETSDEVFEKLPSSPGDDLEEVDTLKETEHETGNVASSVEFVNTPLDAIVAFADRAFYTAHKGCEEASIDDFFDEAFKDASEVEQLKIVQELRTLVDDSFHRELLRSFP